MIAFNYPVVPESKPAWASICRPFTPAKTSNCREERLQREGGIGDVNEDKHHEPRRITELRQAGCGWLFSDHRLRDPLAYEC